MIKLYYNNPLSSNEIDMTYCYNKRQSTIKDNKYIHLST